MTQQTAIADSDTAIQSEKTTETLLTPVQVAAFLQVKLPRVYEAVKARRLRAVRIGRQLRFRRQDVDAFVDRNVTARW